MLLGYFAVAVLAVVLAPFEWSWPPRSDFSVLGPAGGRFGDLLLNVALFVPLGFLFDRTTAGRWRVGGAVLLGLAAAVAIETAQLAIPGRWSSLSDVATNTLGAGLGALGSTAMRRRTGSYGRAIGRLFLDLPLVGFLWLMIPLLWLDALSAGSTVAVLPAAAAAGVALAAAARSSTPIAGGGTLGLVPLAGGWAVVALSPLAVVHWSLAALAMSVVVLATVVAAWRFDALRRRERRVERRAVLLIMLLLLPFLVATTMPGIVPGLGNAALLARQGILRWLCGVAAFTITGYLMAEWHGRTRRRWPETAVAPMIVAALVTPLADPGHGVAGRLLPAVLAAGLGALLFELQREHVMALRRRAAHDAAATNVTIPAPEG